MMVQKLFAQVAKLQMPGRLEAEVGDALRSLCGFRESYSRQYRNVVIGLLLNDVGRRNLVRSASVGAPISL